MLMRTVPMFHYAGLGLKRQIPRRGGNSIEYRMLNRPSAATTALVEGTPPTETQTTWISVTATVAQYGAFTKVSDLAQRQSIDEVMDEHTKMFGEHAGDTIDRIARAILVAGTNVDEESLALAA
jgi:N4-gp56 family major capsid protein